MSSAADLRFKSMNDLLHSAKVDFTGIKPSNVYNRLARMRELADTARKKGDEETEYIMLRRWLNCVEWLKRTIEYRDDKTNSRINQINEVKNILADLDQKLGNKYKQRLKQKVLSKTASSERMEVDVDTQSGKSLFVPTIDGPIRLPETPTKDPLTDNEEFMSCDQLFQTLRKPETENRCLIVDIRPVSQFEVSHIKSERCINIPDSEIKIGILPSFFEKYLYKDKRSFTLFKRRGTQYNDVIVLLNWDGTSANLAPNNHLYIFKKILEEWDMAVKYNKIMILDGGYREWLTRYPAFTTNPKIVEPTTTTAPSEILEDIVYPDWVHSDDEDGIQKIRDTKLPNSKSIRKSEPIVKKDNLSREKGRTKPIYPEMNNIVLAKIRSNNSTPEPMEVELSEIPTDSRQNEDDIATTKLQPSKSSNVIKQIDIPAKPIIDRSSKPLSLNTSSEAKTVLKLMKQLTEIAKDKEKLQQEMLEQEQSLYDGQKSKDSNEEEYIQGNLKSLSTKLDETQNTYVKLGNELGKYMKEIPSIKFTSAEKDEKDNLDLSLTRSKFRIKYIVDERKRLMSESAENEFKSEQQKEEKEIGSNVHKEPLKVDGTSMNPGLERSYSSPNLLQLGGHKAPRVDRSSKPQVSTHNRNGSVGNENLKVSHLSWANREERMTPVHGSVHPGITGLKNLGNSCYMNSIIQCLSNTTHLAKYFTDNLYVDDLNTGNESTTQGQVVEEVAQVIKALWRGQYKSISPHDLKVAVGQYKLQFESYEQQDSHEFLTFLLDWMHNDLRKEYKINHEMSVAEKAWDKAMASQKSIISDLFFGQLRSTITCSTCKQSSTTYETFNSLTTSLPHSSRCTLNDCIQRFVTGQKVLGWKCPKCQTAREATKKFDFVKLAPIIVIHLNRFAESGGWLEKRNTAVEFPLTGFNLKPYLVTDNNTTTISNMRSYNYSLYAMSNHYGTMEGGHYTAFCKNAAQNKWYKYDDQTVTEVTSHQVKSQTNTAYLLFYTSFSSNII